LSFAAVLTLIPVTAEATISRAMQFEDKVENAAAIVLGKCIRQTSQWDAARNWILTYSTFQVEKTLKGQPAREITIVTPGGQVGEIAQEVVGVPKFRQGDEHVVFVRNSSAGPTVLYLEQGAYKVVKDDRGDREVRPLVSTAVLVDTQRGTAIAPERPRPLRNFEENVRETVRRREQLRMQMLEREKQRQASLWYQLQRNKTLVLLALVGAVLATWQILKRTS
ncbi:MAG TPA: hypothetical protein VHK90_02745, partial [Thermoanaerobaculia bacterium]|nr:hypothetical protein [Thermoanaerobaculia bacterium]